jgi:hypothetical protein
MEELWKREPFMGGVGRRAAPCSRDFDASLLPAITTRVAQDVGCSSG